MGYWSEKLIEQEILDRGYDGPTVDENKGICEVCGSEYSCYCFNDDTPGFREHYTVEHPCKCGKHYGRAINVDELKVSELKEILKYHKVKGYSKLNKSELVKLVKEVLLGGK